MEFRHAPIVEELAPLIVSRKWTCQLSSGHRFPSAAAIAALGHHGMSFPQQAPADQGGPGAGFVGRDGGPQPGTAGADHNDVV